MARDKSIKNLDDATLLDNLTDASEELFNLRFQHVTGQLDNDARLGQVRKQVARVKTEIREREIAAAEATHVEENV